MGRRLGAQAEVLSSLALIALTATSLLGVILLGAHQKHLGALHGLLGRGFVAESGTPGWQLHGAEDGLVWTLDASGTARPIGHHAQKLDPASRALAERARAQGSVHVQSGAPWNAVRFAAPGPRDTVHVGRLDPPLPGWALAVLVSFDLLVFAYFGWALLRKRIVRPLDQLAWAVRAVGEGEPIRSAPVDGVEEIRELDTAFRDMQGALSGRTEALEKAVVELREANQQLRTAREGLDRSERLALVGSLSAGVAHEVGNPMGALLAFLDVAARDPGLGPGGRRALDRAVTQGERVRVILRQLLDFSRAPRIEAAPFALQEVATQVIGLVEAQREYEGIQLELETAEQTPDAFGDSGIASQLLLNLVLNAAAAVESCESRRIRLIVSEEHRQRRAADAEPGPQSQRAPDGVACRVEDSGPGVPDELAERIFDPFFTTKDPGRGTGLGLANARHLAEEMGGRLDLEQTRGPLGGARFRLWLPTEHAAASSVGAAVRSPDPELNPGSRTP